MGFREKLAAANGTDFLTTGIPPEELSVIVREARLQARRYREIMEGTAPDKAPESSDGPRLAAGHETTAK